MSEDIDHTKQQILFQLKRLESSLINLKNELEFERKRSEKLITFLKWIKIRAHGSALGADASQAVKEFEEANRDR